MNLINTVKSFKNLDIRTIHIIDYIYHPKNTKCCFLPFLRNKQYQILLYRCYSIRNNNNYKDTHQLYRSNSIRYNDIHTNDINTQLDLILAKPSNIHTIKELDDYVKDQLNNKNNQNQISTIMYKISESKFKLSDDNMYKIVMLINELKSMNMISLCKIFYSLKPYHTTDYGIIPLLKELAKKLASRLDGDPMDGKGITSILLGLKGMKCDILEVREVLKALLPHIIVCKDIFKPVEISQVLYGLQSMGSDILEVRKIMKAITPHIKVSNGIYKPNEISQALNSLQKMRSDLIEVQGILKVLIPHINKCKGIFKADEITYIIYGLRNMRSDILEVRQLLKALLPHIQICKDKYKPREICNALYGLQNMSSDILEIREILKILIIPHIKLSNNFHSNEICQALYGLKNMNSDDMEVREILQALILPIKKCKDIFKPQNISKALYGLQGINNNCKEVYQILESLMPYIQSNLLLFQNEDYEKCLFIMSFLYLNNENITNILMNQLLLQLDQYLDNNYHNNKLTDENICSIERGINIFEFKQSNNNISNEIMNLIDIVKTKIILAKTKTYVQPIFIGHSEKYILLSIHKLLKNRKDIKIFNNTFKDGFELDILIERNDNNNIQLYNIEIDGPLHEIANTKKFMKIRDELLSKKYNIIIKRIPLRVNNVFIKLNELDGEIYDILYDLSIIK